MRKKDNIILERSRHSDESDPENNQQSNLASYLNHGSDSNNRANDQGSALMAKDQGSALIEMQSVSSQ